MMVEKILEKYQFDSVFGFVIQTPLEKLDPYFDPWINLVKKIEILRKTPDKFREIIKNLEVLNTEKLEDDDDVGSLQLCHTLLSILAHSYVHLDPENPCKFLPRSLSIPWCSVSTRLGVPPVVIHSTMSLSNWRRKIQDQPMELENISTIFSFDSSRDLEVLMKILIILLK